MKKIIAVLLCAAMAATALCACGDPTQLSGNDTLSDDYTRSTDPTDTYNYNDGVTVAPSIYTTYSNELTDFELRLFRNYYSTSGKSEKSFVLAPVNTALQLGYIANGGSDDVKSEIMTALGKDLEVADFNQCSSYFKSRIEAVSKTESSETNSLSGKKEESDKNAYVKLDNSLFFNDTADVKSTFLQNGVNYYGENIFRFMFSDENALTKINNHYADFTSGQALDNLDAKQDLISITAADICDSWLNVYAQSDLEKGTFKATSGDTDVTYMTSNEVYVKSSSAQGIIKYTDSTPLKMMVVMPNEDISIDNYVSNFTNLEFSNLLDSFDVTKSATVKIPEFSIDTTKTARGMSDALSKSGLYSLFTEKAEFTNMTHTDDFAIDQMYELGSKVTVNAAGLGGQNSSGDKAPLTTRTKELEKQKQTVDFNRPFIFVIFDNESNIPLYLGVVDF